MQTSSTDDERGGQLLQFASDAVATSSDRASAARTSCRIDRAAATPRSIAPARLHRRIARCRACGCRSARASAAGRRRRFVVPSVAGLAIGRADGDDLALANSHPGGDTPSPGSRARTLAISVSPISTPQYVCRRPRNESRDSIQLAVRRKLIALSTTKAGLTPQFEPRLDLLVKHVQRHFAKKLLGGTPPERTSFGPASSRHCCGLMSPQGAGVTASAPSMPMSATVRSSPATGRRYASPAACHARGRFPPCGDKRAAVTLEPAGALHVADRLSE